MSPEFVNYSLDLLSGNTLINRVLYMKNQVSSSVNDNLRARGMIQTTVPAPLSPFKSSILTHLVLFLFQCHPIACP